MSTPVPTRQAAYLRALPADASHPRAEHCELAVSLANAVRKTMLAQGNP